MISILSAKKISLSFLSFAFLVFPMHAKAQDINNTPPAELSVLQNIESDFKPDKKSTALPLDIRGDALKEAAFSYGARGGLSWRTYLVSKELEKQARYLDKVFDFRQLLIPAPSGLLIEPPIISESFDSMFIEGDGREAAVADRVINIGRNARIVSAARTWRFYLERQWGEVLPPPDVLRPINDKERAEWIEHVAQGWEKGIEQANEIFQADLNQLVADYQGMIRYRTLLAQGMVSPPYALQVDKGVTGGGDTMRIGDRALSITDPSRLNASGYREWQPANR